ncbi:MAG: ATP-binding protein [Candidatus Aminicenantes bacterium]|nr:ATP-binding protein [Candidatus Aminicenantes bacterium]
MSDKEELEELKKTFEDFIATSTQLQQSYEVLKAESQLLSLYLSNILENIPSAILVFDNNFNLTLWNSISTHYFPFLERKKPPVPQQDLTPINKIESFAGIKNILEGQGKQKPIEIETEINGENKWLEIDSSDFIDNKKEKTGYLMVIQDKTEFKKLQIKSRQEDRLRVMGELAAGMAHEIRNPLGSIELMVTLMQEDEAHKTDKRGSELLSRIRSSVDNMNHIVTNILLYTKDLHLEQSQFPVEKLLTDAESIALNTITKKQVMVEKNIAPTLLSADYELLKQSIANVLINAAQAAPIQGRITIETEAKKDRLLIKIKDNGPGIPEDIKEKIFKPFFTTKTTGTGLGLAMVKRVIEAHAGNIFFQSGPKGTLFIIEIPLK